MIFLLVLPTKLTPIPFYIFTTHIEMRKTKNDLNVHRMLKSITLAEPISCVEELIILAQHTKSSRVRAFSPDSYPFYIHKNKQKIKTQFIHER